MVTQTVNGSHTGVIKAVNMKYGCNETQTGSSKKITDFGKGWAGNYSGLQTAKKSLSSITSGDQFA
jgi:hypothetical protein